MNKIAMMSLYMDRGETIKYAAESIGRISVQKPSAVYYDILCRPDQLELAGKWLGYIYKLVKEMNPQLIDEAIFFGLTTNDEFRPAAMSLASSMKDQPMPPFLDLNPERKGR